MLNLIKRILIFFIFTTSIAMAANTEKAIFAGGCFWCMQPPYDKLKGVVSTTVGYIGGKTPNPTYKKVSAGNTGYVEAIQVTYDPKKVNYQTLLNLYWHNVDPTRNDGQFCDKGKQYRPEIFYLNPQQKQLAEASKAKIKKSGMIKQPILVAITPAGKFYPAEQYHQNYYKKNPLRYRFYRYTCGRDKRLKQLWGSKAKKVN
ncbi:MAG: peptide-methionine (S)-S-oxide reductase MsrA [Pseudomonadota bacterium]